MQTQNHRTSTVLSLKQIESATGKELVDRVTDYLTDRHLSPQANLAAETTICWFARKRWVDYCSQDVRRLLHENALTRTLSVPLERISAVTACMNRNDHILKTLPSWLSSKRFEEIIIVDYGSSEPLEKTLSKNELLNHPSIRIVRLEAEKWCLAEAFNAGMFEAKAPFTIKLDADTLIHDSAESSLRLSSQQFRTGNWRTFENNVLNGVVLAPTEAIHKVGGYNEQIRRYGWDDCDFYERLSELALIKTDLVEREFSSLDHSDDERVANSDEIAKDNDINRLIQGNRVLVNLLPKWTDKGRRQFVFNSLAEGDQKQLASIREFAYTISKIQDDYIHAEDSSYGYSAMIGNLSSLISKGSGQQQILPSTKTAPIVLMTSLYEDRAETRRREMIRCLRINSQIFDKIIILYEQPSEIVSGLEASISDELKRLSGISRYERHLADIEVIAIHERPAYCDFFKVSNSFVTESDSPWFVIANSDIAFDKTIERIHELRNPDHYIICLSRWDKCSDVDVSSDDQLNTYFDPEGVRWAPIQSDINGSLVPNYLSADAWIYKSLPQEWNEYTYKLGTYFCDSFFANRAFRSGQNLINPCHSIRCFHYHEEVINSSAQKFENKADIELLHSQEKKRLGGDDPVAGVQWSTLETCNSSYLKLKPYRWNSKGGLWLRLGHCVNATSTLLTIEAALKETEASGKDVYISLLCDERYEDTIKVVLEFADYLCSSRLFLDLQPSIFDPSFMVADQELLIPDDCTISYGNWDQLAHLITSCFEGKSHSCINDCVHLKLLNLLSIDELYSVKFLSSRHVEYFHQQKSEAFYIAQFSSCLTTQITPRFSLITSLFRGKNYLPRLLENYEAIASLGSSEIVIVDVNSDSSDSEIVEPFIRNSKYGHTVNYIKLEDDPGIYGCWMKAISMARSPFVSNFNADDRRSAVHPYILADYLENNPDVDACFTALKPTKVPNLSWYQHTELEAWFNWFENGQSFKMDDFITQRDGIYCSNNIAHCMPMWRKSLHDELGPFREDKYGTSADWAFWLECLKHNKNLALASNDPLGLYLVNQHSHNRINDTNGELEKKIIYDYFQIIETEFVQQ